MEDGDAHCRYGSSSGWSPAQAGYYPELAELAEDKLAGLLGDARDLDVDARGNVVAGMQPKPPPSDATKV